MGGVVGDARKRLAEGSAEQVLTALPVSDATLAEWRALLAEERCLCSSASTDWESLEDLVAEVQSLRVLRDALERKVARLRASLASAWSAYLEVALDDRLEDGTLVLQLALGQSPELRARLVAVLDGGLS